MAQKKINPTAFRLSTKQTWWTITHNSTIHQDMFIRKLIKGIFKAFNILTSEIAIKRKGKLIFIDLLVFPYNTYYNQKNIFSKNPHFPHIKLPLLTQNRNLEEKKLAFEGILPFINKNKNINKTKNKILMNFSDTYYLNTSQPFRYHYLKSFMELLLNKRFEGSNSVFISITQAPSIASNAHIFSEWMKLELKRNPLKYKLILNRAKNMYLDYQKNSLSNPKETTSFINSFKHHTIS